MTSIKVDTRLIELVDVVVSQPDSRYNSSTEFIEEAIRYNIRRVARANRKALYPDNTGVR